ncbi:unnamed protein product [Phytomonas sp. Hart1]|nr:unnamed protein product [Phytomonas sp. Hart1]|eukprot:CCW67024.1 unnamed protein product [Phytomonas sp. isolate Hart1]
MPRLVVEYAKSGRSVCSASTCGLKIVKHEIRIGSVSDNPFEEGAGEIVKWRHLCCFSDRQLKNAKDSGALEEIEGVTNLSSSDKELVLEFQKGELGGKSELIGRVGDVLNSPLAEALGTKKKQVEKGRQKSHKKDRHPQRKHKKRSRRKINRLKNGRLLLILKQQNNNNFVGILVHKHAWLCISPILILFRCCIIREKIKSVILIFENKATNN